VLALMVAGRSVELSRAVVTLIKEYVDVGVLRLNVKIMRYRNFFILQ